MFLFDMKLGIVKQEFSIRSIPIPRSEQYFRILSYAELLKRQGLFDADLMAIHELPSLDIAYQEMVETGHANSVMDLGTSDFVLPSRYQRTPVLL